MDLFIHLLVHLFVYLFIDMSIPLSVHSLMNSFSHILSQPNTFPYIERRQTEIDQIVSLSSKFQMNWPIESLAFHRFGTRGDQLNKSPCIKDFNCFILKESKQRLI